MPPRAPGPGGCGARRVCSGEASPPALLCLGPDPASGVECGVGRTPPRRGAFCPPGAQRSLTPPPPAQWGPGLAALLGGQPLAGQSSPARGLGTLSRCPPWTPAGVRVHPDPLTPKPAERAAGSETSATGSLSHGYDGRPRSWGRACGWVTKRGEGGLCRHGRAAPG